MFQLLRKTDLAPTPTREREVAQASPSFRDGCSILIPERCSRSGAHCVLRRGQAVPSFPRTPFLASGALPPLRSGYISLDEAEHFLHNRSASVATLRWYSGSSQNAVRNHPGFSVRLRRNPQPSFRVLLETIANRELRRRRVFRGLICSYYLNQPDVREALPPLRLAPQRRYRTAVLWRRVLKPREAAAGRLGARVLRVPNRVGTVNSVPPARIRAGRLLCVCRDS